MAMQNNGSIKLAAGLSGAVLLLAGILGWKGVLPPNGIITLAVLALGGFVAVALKDR